MSKNTSSPQAHRRNQFISETNYEESNFNTIQTSSRNNATVGGKLTYAPFSPTTYSRLVKAHKYSQKFTDSQGASSTNTSILQKKRRSEQYNPSVNSISHNFDLLPHA